MKSLMINALESADPINILIVDDEPANLLVLETVLDDPGYRLVRAQTADQALLALVAAEFALLILDIRMPGMTGFELAQIIKERKKTAGVPIIFLTAYYDKDQHILEGYETGAVDFLNKPVNPAVLRSKVSVFADLHRKNRAIRLANNALLAEVAERRRAEDQLRELNETLELRVSERTEALRQADQKLQLMMNSITDGLLMLDRDWCFTYCNEQGARLLGTRAEQMVGASVWQMFPHTAGSPFEAGLRHAIATRQTGSFEAFYPEPLSKWLQCHCYPSDDSLSVYFHDISDRHEVEVRREQLLAAEQAARGESERMARAKDEFLASLSHELRTPLAAILGWAKVLERPGNDETTLRRGIEAIARNAQAQAQLVADLLDVSRIVSGKLLMTVEQVDVNTVAAAAVDTARPAFAAKGVGLDLKLSREPLREIMGDPVRLHQIVCNLVNNALKFTPAGGLVTVSTRVGEGHVELAVSDNGQGIAADFLPHLFERFSQADGSAARVHGGLGLGLSIVKSLMDLHAGSVTARSEGKGLGATFSLRFPQATSEVGLALRALSLPAAPGNGASPMHLAGPESAVDLKGLRLLLVDDHADMLEAERRMLSDCGAAVTAVASAELALQCLRSARFDVLLSDLGMPHMDGYALINAVRTTLGLSAADLPAAAVTAFVRPEDHQRALQAGYQACILKPVSPAAFARTVLELMQGLDTFGPQGGANHSTPPPGRQDASSTTGTAHASAAQPRLRALFVEDHADLREQIGWMLEEEGLDVVTCANGEDAEAEFRKGGFDLVLTDISLPKRSGVDLARRVLAQSPQTWVIFSTGYEMGNRLSHLGPHVRMLLKPFEFDELHLLMDEVRADLQVTG